MPLTRRNMLGGLAAAPVFGAARRPNTLFVLIDDLRYNCLSLLGHPWIKTPNIDRIGREGAIFTNAFVTTPLCSPSRASFLTGRWVHSHGIVDNTNRNEQSHKLITFPALQRAAGYETAYVGKWHMGNDSMPRPGFDHWVSFPGQGQYNDPQINTNGTLEKRTGFMTDILTEAALEFLKRKRTKPFSLYLAHKAVHGPFTPPGRHKDLYAALEIPRHPNAQGPRKGKPALEQPLTPNKQGTQGQGGPSDEMVRNQMRLLAAVDEGMGQILSALETTGELDNTLIVFTSDNGYFHGDHGLGDKRAAYDEALRIPMLARYPKWIRPGTKIEADVLNVDIGPTMVDVAGGKPAAEMRGASITPLLQGRRAAWRKDFYAEYFFEPQYPRVPGWHAVRTPEWKLVEYRDHPEWAELYNLKKDPYEMENLAGDRAASGTRQKLAARLSQLQKETA
jgi:N-acetylglucosamine-6-sulfatase